MRKLFNLFFVLLFINLNYSFSQIYSPTLKTYLDNAVDETSGLIFYNGKVWTHNDSGGKAKLYNIDTITGQVNSVKIITNAKNRDWEDVCVDDNYAYIGDIGNNSGKLEKFTIYKIPLEDLDSEAKDSISAEKIIFSYDSTYYVKSTKNHVTNFDCESLIAKGDSLYIFSKNWSDKKCYFYSVPKEPGEYIASLRDTIDVNGLICGADYNSQTNTLALIGYVYGIPAPSLLVLISGFDDDNFFDGTIMRKELKLKGCQTEGIAFVNNFGLLISNENFLKYKQALRSILLTDNKSGEYADFYINLNDQTKNIEFKISVPGRYKIQITDISGKTVCKIKKKKYNEDVHSIDINNLESGNYCVNIYKSKISFYKKINVKNVE